MISRRTLLGGICSCVSLAAAPSKADTGAKLSRPICLTIDKPSDTASPLAPGDGFKFNNMSALSDSFKFQDGADTFVLDPRGVSFVKDRWTSQDGLNRGNHIITLGVAFLNGNESQKQLVRQSASIWTSSSVLGE